MSTQYVAGFLFHYQLNHVALIRKARPKWMAGKLNAIGGHVEPGEVPLHAMVREFEEEAGLVIPDWKRFAVLSGANDGGWSVDWFWAQLVYDAKIRSTIRSTTIEEVSWYNVGDLLRGDSEVVVPNLTWLLLMAINDLRRKDACSLFRIEEAERY
jgi:8-oxo-dGTP pyrophosphatase MutT (NUDIX family)